MLLMSLTRVVPSGVPSLFQSSFPCVLLEAEKYKASPANTGTEGELPPTPRLMSLTSVVPSGVPLLFQISKPLDPSFATKKMKSLKMTRFV